MRGRRAVRMAAACSSRWKRGGQRALTVAFATAALIALSACASDPNTNNADTTAAPAYPPVPASFYETWSDGNGEVNSYELVEERYGERREGNAVLVFAAEELNRNTYVKVESDATPQDQRMYVIKLNQLRKFPTGIYDYSAMTTVFSVAGSHLGHHPFQAARVVHTTQEWCGQVYHRVDLTESGWKEELRSYFEAEGTQDRVSPAARTDVEDNLWIWIRELGGRVLEPGETVEMQLYPSLWELRKTHRPFDAAPVVVKKDAAAPFETPVGTFDAYPWSWTVSGRALTVYVEAEGAHRILGWEDSRGGRARLARSERLPYWRMHGTDADEARERFGLPGFGIAG
ncbi:MAG: hypothetical protein H6682_04615 [Candidatus Eisenbacteria bacterium]|nr:hypothetical protein [Candidatus Eisenbacteria bacterium]